MNFPANLLSTNRGGRARAARDSWMQSRAKAIAERALCTPSYRLHL